MRKVTALVAGMTLAVAATPALAGVVITQKQHISQGDKTKDSEQTIYVQGNKQKMVTDRHTIITDIDKGKLYIMDPKSMSYFELEFPPKQPQMAQMMAAGTSAAMNFKSAGTTREVAGYPCTDYDGGGKMMTGEYTVKECFSTRAPGAAEYAAFEKTMTDKLKGVGPAASGEAPKGMPLALDSTMKMGNMSFPNMPPEQAKKLSDMMSKRPPITTSTVVEKIESKKLAESEFTVPSEYSKKDMPTPGSMQLKQPLKINPPTGAPAAGASPAAQ